MAMSTQDVPASRRAGQPARREARVEQESAGLPLLVAVFLVSLLVPVTLDLGPIRLLAHRFVLLLAVVPLMARLFGGRAGKVTSVDHLVLGATLWAGLAFFVSRPGIAGIESAGMHFIEAFGGYLVARVGIRSAEDFRRFVRLFYALILFLLPFAAIEAFTGRAILLDIIPRSHGEVWAGGERWGLDRAQVLFAHPILYGTFVATGFALAWYALHPAAAFGKRVVTVAPVALAVFFSLSAGALLAFVVQSALVVWDLVFRAVRDRWKILLRLSILGYFVIDFLSNRSPFHLLVAYGTFSSSTGYYRIVIFRHGIDDVFRNPVFGLGSDIGSWTRASWMHGSIDNFWLYTAMSYGIPGFLLLAVATFLAMHRASKAVMPDPVDQACRTGWMIAMIGMILTGGTVHFWTTMLAFFMFMIGAGLWMSTGGARQETAEAAETRSRRRAPLHARPAAPLREAAQDQVTRPRPAVRPRRGRRGPP